MLQALQLAQDKKQCPLCASGKKRAEQAPYSYITVLIISHKIQLLILHSAAYLQLILSKIKAQIHISYPTYNQSTLEHETKKLIDLIDQVNQSKKLEQAKSKWKVAKQEVDIYNLNYIGIFQKT